MKTTFKLGPLGGHFVPAAFTQLHWGSSAFSDLNGDGIDDFIQTGSYYPDEPYPATARQGFVLFGTASGFVAAPSTQFPAAALLNVHARELAFADFNEDGVQDFFIADHGYDAVPFPGQQNLLFLSNKSPTSVSWTAATARLPQVSDFTHSVAVGDVNRDGHADIFAGNGAYSEAYFLIGDGKGGFTSVKPAGNAVAGINIGFTASLLADLDLDGWQDLVLGTGSQSQTHQMFWSNAGSFANTAGVALGAPQNFGNEWSVMDVQAIDMNFDGLPDLVVDYQAHVTQGGWQLQVLINQGGRNFVDETAKYIPNAGVRSGGDPTKGGEAAWIEFLLPRDVNDDGRMDFVVETKAWGKPLPASYPQVLLHQADGTFDTLTAGDLRAVGMPAFMLDNGLHYAERGADQPAEFLQVFAQPDGGVGTNAASITFAAPATYWIGGSSSADVLTGTKGADDMGGFGGDDKLDGGAGIDIARYNAKRVDSILQRSSTGWTVTSAADGKDTLSNIERLKFADTSWALDLEGNAGSVAKILGAVFGTQFLANKDFVGIGLKLLDAGVSYANVVSAAVGTELFAQLAGSRSNTDFVNFIYKNVTGVLPGQAALNQYIGLLNNGTFTQASLALAASESDFNKVHINLVGLATTGIEFIPAL